MLTADGCWAEFRIGRRDAEGRPCCFLDRDGVVIEDTGYPHRAEEVRLYPEVLEVVRAANERGMVVGLVTNQSGIGRGMFGWAGFEAVQDVIETALAARGARLDFVLACPHHPEARLEHYRCPRHPWRKPEPGMMAAVAETLAVDLGASLMIGDSATDMDAAASAGIPHRILVADRPDEPAQSRGAATAVATRAQLRALVLGLAEARARERAVGTAGQGPQCSPTPIPAP